MRTEAQTPRYRGLDAWPPREILEALLERQFSALAAVRAALPAIEAAALAARDRLRGGGRLAYAGAGTSGRLALLDAVELYPTFGWPKERTLVFLAGGERAAFEAVEEAEDDEAAGRAAGSRLGAQDVLVGVSASGRTPFVLGAVEAARERGALTLGVANNPGSPLLQAAEHPVLLDTGPEVIAGSTRLAAGTAQKVALNLFSTLVMTLLGGVYDNLMVGVVPTNEKLRRRAAEIVARIAGVDEEAAERALRRADYEVKTAVLVARGLSPEEARVRLLEAGGRLREALR
ncbi:MAG TPA: N-acetylmuramic acid 6-phosphate etherase [Oceanithermus sp.]|nr:N-acetylmuramic acid 6-phosphate etherase [Oceanithermus sp.]